MTADCRTILGKLRVFCADKNDTRLDFLGILHTTMNLVVGVGKRGEGCGIVIRKKDLGEKLSRFELAENFVIAQFHYVIDWFFGFSDLADDFNRISTANPNFLTILIYRTSNS